MVRELPWFSGQVSSVLDFADQGSVPLLRWVITAVDGVAEELFYSAAYAGRPRRPVVLTVRWPTASRPSRPAT